MDPHPLWGRNSSVLNGLHGTTQLYASLPCGCAPADAPELGNPALKIPTPGAQGLADGHWRGYTVPCGWPCGCPAADTCAPAPPGGRGQAAPGARSLCHRRTPAQTAKLMSVKPVCPRHKHHRPQRREAAQGSGRRGGPEIARPWVQAAGGQIHPYPLFGQVHRGLEPSSRPRSAADPASSAICSSRL